MLSRHSIISARREYVIIGVSSVCAVPFKTRGRVVSLANSIAIYRNRVLGSVKFESSVKGRMQYEPGDNCIM
jgi:hypothetical protein